MRGAFSVQRSAFCPYLYNMSFEIQSAIELIPQRAPFVFVDSLIYIDDKTSHGIFKIPSENIFVKSGYYSASGMVESLAQTAAAGTGGRSVEMPAPVVAAGARLRQSTGGMNAFGRPRIPGLPDRIIGGKAAVHRGGVAFKIAEVEGEHNP